MFNFIFCRPIILYGYSCKRSPISLFWRHFHLNNWNCSWQHFFWWSRTKMGGMKGMILQCWHLWTVLKNRVKVFWQNKKTSKHMHNFLTWYETWMPGQQRHLLRWWWSTSGVFFCLLQRLGTTDAKSFFCANVRINLPNITKKSQTRTLRWLVVL